MKTKLTTILITVLCATVFAAEPIQKPVAELFAAGETSLDLAATYSASRVKFNDAFDRSYRHGDFGLAVGATHWLTKHFGGSADAVLPAVDDVDGSIISDVSLSVKARYPIGSFSPYGLAGGGRNVGEGQWTYHAGAGLDYRFNPKWSVFAEGRYIWTQHRSDTARSFVGLRYAF